MLIPRFFHEQELEVGAEVTLSSSASRHLIVVLRAKTNAKCIVFNGDNFEYLAKITVADKKKCQILLEKKINPKTESNLNIHLAQVVSASQRMYYTIQKASELGVNQITPLFSEFSKKNWYEQKFQKKKSHWHNIMVSACEQSGRVKIPKINQATDFLNFIDNTSSALKIILEPEAEISLQQQMVSNNDIIIVVGAETGFSKTEIASAENNNFIPIKIGPRILRTETVAPAILAILQNIAGDI